MTGIKAAEAERKSCFFIGPIGGDDTAIRKHSDQVLKHIVRKALEPKYEVQRADDINRSGTIIAQIVERVFNADLVVADLTGPNANVFYELAIRHATKRPAVHLTTVGGNPPFDINQIRLITFDLTNPDSIEEAQRRLKEQVEAIEGGLEVTTPVQFAQILHSLGTGTPKDKQFLEVLEGLSQGILHIRSQIGYLQSQVNQIQALQLVPEPRHLVAAPIASPDVYNQIRSNLWNSNSIVARPVANFFATGSDEVPVAHPLSTIAPPDEDKKD